MFMPTLNLVTELTVDDLLDVVARLDEAELAEFEIRFEQLWLSQPAVADKEAAYIAATRRLGPRQQARLRVLLEKNREEGVTDTEAKEMDEYIAEIDRALEETVDDLLKLAERRRQAKTNDTQ
jgi:hypothetical protein